MLMPFPRLLIPWAGFHAWRAALTIGQVAFLLLRMIKLLPAILIMAMPAFALTVRVDSAGGAPRILVNGKPVRARMFWGAPGSAPLRITGEWQKIQFEFTAFEDAENGTFHFRFGRQAGDVWLDDIQVVDLETGRDLIPKCTFENGQADFSRDWTYWPPGDKNTVGSIKVERGVGAGQSAGLQITLRNPPDGQWPDFHIYHHPRLKIARGRKYLVTFSARAEPARDLTVAFYRPGAQFVHLGGPGGVFESQIKLAAAAGVNFVSFPIEMPWPKPGVAPDWASVDAACERILRVNPEALLLPRMGMDPPKWWREAHPEAVMQWEDGSRKAGAVVASSLYRREASRQLSALVEHLEEKFGEHVAGYHPCGQNTGEWFYHDTWKPALSGYAPEDIAAWRAWLGKRYSSDAELQSSWGVKGITCAEAKAPVPAERHASPDGVFRNPRSERHLIDWAQFQQEAMADCVCELARAVRQASHGKKLVVFFYGYVFEFGAVATSPAVSGHYALRRVLDCPDIDVLCSPISYFDRGPGGNAPSMTAAESVALAGKMWLNEDDTHTYRATGDVPGSADHASSLEETNHELVRNVAQEAMRNFGTWWMDLTATGWFNDPAMWREMARLKPLDDAMLNQPTPFRPEVALVIDEKAMSLLAPAAVQVTRPGVYEVRRAVGRMGAPYGQYLLDDVLAGRVKARLYIFLNAWNLTGSERAALLRAIRGQAAIWCYAPGYFDNGTVSMDAMRELTGFQLAPVQTARAEAIPTEAGRRLGMQATFGSTKSIKPLFRAADAGLDETLAEYPGGGAAVVARKTTTGLSVFVGAPGLSSDLLRAVARHAGIHLYTQQDCNVYANGPFIALHASQDGPLEIHMGKAGRLIDMLAGSAVGQGPVFKLQLKRGETRLLRMVPN